ncbi:hypothetical protein TNCV_4992441 [Trichonephila clavipes]|nr:hypothetical protein TNCV_4992441 [Trichonephila clavipes]
MSIDSSCDTLFKFCLTNKKGRSEYFVLCVTPEKKTHKGLWQDFWVVIGPEFSPCENHMFSLLKKAMKRRRFPDDKEVQAAEENWFHNQHRGFFTHGIHHIGV